VGASWCTESGILVGENLLYLSVVEDSHTGRWIWGTISADINSRYLRVWIVNNDQDLGYEIRIIIYATQYHNQIFSALIGVDVGETRFIYSQHSHSIWS
jgi:hypothetical protein